MNPESSTSPRTSGESAAPDPRLQELREQHCYITSTDSCCHCGDGECDGIGCIASLDPDDDRDYEAMENLHTLLREGQAWRVMQAVLEAGEEPITAYSLAHEALAFANNQPATEDPRVASFAAAWASKCEELARETAKVTALIDVIRGVVEASRPGTTKAQRDEAWAAVGAITLLDEARADGDFMARLARVREEYR